MMAAPQDHGWAWLVLLSSTTINFFMFGSYSSFSVYFMEMSREFGETRALTSWVGAIAMGVSFLVGPLGSCLTERFGSRPVAIGGSLISALGYSSSFFAPNIFVLFGTYGFLTGLGFGIAHVAGIIAVSRYFWHRRTLATALSMAGGGFGQLGLPPITRLLIDVYGWRGTMWIYAGFSLQLCVCGSLLRPITTSQETGNQTQTPQTENVKPQHEEPPSPVPRGKAISMGHLPSAHTHLAHSRRNLHRSKLGVSEASLYLELTRSGHHLHTIGSQLTLPGKGSLPDLHLSTKDDHVAVTTPHMEDAESHQGKATFLQILLTAVSSWMWSVNIFSVIVFVSAYAVTIGVAAEHAAFIVTVLGTFNTAGRVIVGILGGHPAANLSYIFLICTILHGAATLLLAFSSDFLSVSVFTAAVGLFYGMKWGLLVSLLTELFGLHQLPRLYGISMFCVGLGGLTGPPLSGWVADVSSHFLSAFFFSGTLGVSSMLLFMGLLYDMRSRRLQGYNIASNYK